MTARSAGGMPCVQTQARARVQARARASATIVLAAALLLPGCAWFGHRPADRAEQTPAKTAAAPSPAEVTAVAIKATLAQARANLVALQADTALAALAPAEIADAEAALQTAEISQFDAVSGSHQAYVADHKILLARARAETRRNAAQVQALRARRDALRDAAAAR